MFSLIPNALSAGLKICWLYTLQKGKTFPIILTPPQKKNQGCPELDTKRHLMVMVQFCRSGKCAVSLHCHYSKVHFWPEMVVSVKVPSMGQIDLSEKLFIFDRTMCKEPLKKPLRKECKYECTMTDSLTSWHKLTLDKLTGC